MSTRAHSIVKLEKALHTMHKRACGDSSAVYMSVPPDFDNDADMLLSDALEELKQWRDWGAKLCNTNRSLAEIMSIISKISQSPYKPT